MGRFRDALARPGLAAIAEIKRRSPSAGDLRPDADPAELAASFGRARAAAISVLVDARFAGSVDDLRAARAATDTPLLAKGFFVDEAQLDELAAAGADAVLLLLRDLDDRRARALLARAGELGLDALVEAHDGAELARAAALEAPVVGVNARDLGTFAIGKVPSTSSRPRLGTASWSRRSASSLGPMLPQPSWRARTRSSSARR